jgi:hypothetical protein
MQKMLGNDPRVRMLPTPTGDDANNATRDSGAYQSPTCAVGSLNPQFVCWLMGYPLDWCDMPEESQQASPTE